MQNRANENAVLNGEGVDAVRRRRIIFRAWHRGIREMDLLLGRYVSAHIAAMNEAELEALERLMAYEDADLLHFFTGEAPVPAAIDRRLFQAVLAGGGRELSGGAE